MQALFLFSLIPQIYHKYCILKAIFDVMQIFYFLVPADQGGGDSALQNKKKLSEHASFLEKVVAVRTPDGAEEKLKKLSMVGLRGVG